jgi:hypothetical protein
MPMEDLKVRSETDVLTTSLSTLMTGCQNWFFVLWKYLIPTFPK